MLHSEENDKKNAHKNDTSEHERVCDPEQHLLQVSPNIHRIHKCCCFSWRLSKFGQSNFTLQKRKYQPKKVFAPVAYTVA